MVRTIFGMLVGLMVGIAGVVFFGWLLWWLWTQREEETEAASIEIEAGPPPPVTEPPAAEGDSEPAVAEAEAVDEPPEPDDLRRVEGIGPKIASILQDAGIMTFNQLASADVGQLEEILSDADPRLLRLADPATWPEQAALAAEAEWEALEALQSELKAGRRG
jgi:predicted flap endonuclease-1-like 5' DNA nuclease